MSWTGPKINIFVKQSGRSYVIVFYGGSEGGDWKEVEIEREE